MDNNDYIIESIGNVLKTHLRDKPVEEVKQYVKYQILKGNSQNQEEQVVTKDKWDDYLSPDKNFFKDKCIIAGEENQELEHFSKLIAFLEGKANEV